MNQDDRRKYLIEGLLKERPEYENMGYKEWQGACTSAV